LEVLTLPIQTTLSHRTTQPTEEAAFKLPISLEARDHPVPLPQLVNHLTLTLLVKRLLEASAVDRTKAKVKSQDRS
jgi:hypothetical protein